MLATGAAVAFLVLAVLFQQRTRTIEGTWIREFEGSAFFENKDITAACSPAFDAAPWLGYYPAQDTAEGKLIYANRDSVVLVSEYGERPVAAYRLKFIGRRQFMGFGFGHLGSDASEYVVDRMLSIKPVQLARCDVRPA